MSLEIKKEKTKKRLVIFDDKLSNGMSLRFV